MKLLLVAITAVGSYCAPVERAVPARPPVPVYAWCGVHPDHPHAQAQADTLARDAGIDATFGPCNPPDWTTYTPATPGPRYSDPATYMRLLHINAAAGMQTFVYDARLWDDDPQVRVDALVMWQPHTRWIAGWDMSDEWDEGQWAELERRWSLVYSEVSTVTGVLPFTNNLPWRMDAALDLEGEWVGFDDYNLDSSLATARRYAPLVPRLTCAVNAMTHGPFVATSRQVRFDMLAHRDAGCDAILLFGGVRPIDTPGFDVDSLVTDTGRPTELAAAAAGGGA